MLRQTTAELATRAARPVLIAGEELLVSALEQVQPLLLATVARAGQAARAAAVRVSAAERGVVVTVTRRRRDRDPGVTSPD